MTSAKVIIIINIQMAMRPNSNSNISRKVIGKKNNQKAMLPIKYLQTKRSTVIVSQKKARTLTDGPPQRTSADDPFSIRVCSTGMVGRSLNKLH
jgi:hypothetical protein